MPDNHPISWLMFFTLAAGVVIVGLAFINFIRSRSNREIAANTLEGAGTGRGMAADGALPELIGVTVFAFIAMGLLAAGVSSDSGERIAAQPTPAANGSTTGMAQPEGVQNQPKRYQPNNPGTDTRVAPTASDAGAGAASGAHGTAK